jgi:hypothetical protein
MGRVTIEPDWAGLNHKQSQTFTATLKDSSNQNFAWAVSGGRIINLPQGNTVEYQAPDASGDYTITAISLEDPTQHGIARIRVRLIHEDECLECGKPWRCSQEPTPDCCPHGGVM